MMLPFGALLSSADLVQKAQQGDRRVAPLRLVVSVHHMATITPHARVVVIWDILRAATGARRPDGGVDTNWSSDLGFGQEAKSTPADIPQA